ncbi:MAG: hypothetical protein ACYC2G_13795 [Gemmatimonadaceae bacterium]
MRLEILPLILAVFVALLGVVLLADAVLDDDGRAPLRERRRSARAERHRWGESLLGAGLLACAAALVGRDSWAYGTTAMFAGVVLLIAGAGLNHRLLRELVLNRGAARRQEEREPRGPEVARRHPEAGPPGPPEPPLRIR